MWILWTAEWRDSSLFRCLAEHKEGSYSFELLIVKDEKHGVCASVRDKAAVANRSGNMKASIAKEFVGFEDAMKWVVDELKRRLTGAQDAHKYDAKTAELKVFG